MEVAASAMPKFDPEEHRNNVFDAFVEYIDAFEFEYEAIAKEPPADTVDKDKWREIQKRKIFLGRYASRTFQTEYKDTVPEADRKQLTFPNLVEKMKSRYEPTKNYTLANHEFHKIVQFEDESFDVYAHRVRHEAQSCHFKCENSNCTVADIMIRDQIIIGSSNNEIRRNALTNQWNLSQLMENGRKLEAATFSAHKIAQDQCSATFISRVRPGKYSGAKRQSNKTATHQCRTCSNKACEGGKQCIGSKMRCFDCNEMGHFRGSQACRAKPKKHRRRTRRVESDSESDSNGSSYSSERSTSSKSSADRGKRHVSTRPRRAKLNRMRIHRAHHRTRNTKMPNHPKYRVSVIIKEQDVPAFADTGADINVLSEETANFLDLPLTSTTTRVRPYGSKSLKCIGYYEGSVTFGDAFAIAKCYVIPGRAETLLSGKLCEALGIIKFNPTPKVMGKRIYKISCKDATKQQLVTEYPSAFGGIGTLHEYKVHFYVDPEAIPVAQPARPIPYHLRDRFQREIEEMKENDIIEEHHGPAPWVSNPVLAPKEGGNIRVTIDMRQVNKALSSTNIPIPRVEDIKAKLSGCKLFSKLDLKSAFHQLELDETSRQLTVFHAGNRLMRYKRLTMGAKPASGELTKALMPIFNNIQGCHVIHDDIVIAGKSSTEHDNALHATMRRIVEVGLTLNPEKCIFGKTQIPFWGMIVSDEGMKPDPSKIEALQAATPPESKEEVMSFLCFVQSFSDFIPHLSRHTIHLRKLTKKNVPFRWSKECKHEFETLKSSLQEKTLLAYFDPTRPTFIFADAHTSGLSAILTQGKRVDQCRPVAYASRATRPEESRYPQLDLEALAVDFALRRFRPYIAGGPKTTVLTDHKPLISIFSNTRKGSIRTDRIKLRHQDLCYEIKWAPGKINPADYLSRHAIPFKNLAKTIQRESNELEKTVWMLQYSPYTESVSMRHIVRDTANDKTLSKLKQYIHKGYVPRSEPDLDPYRKLLPELSIVDQMIMKGTKIVLPRSLWKSAMAKAHQGGHPGINGLKRRIRSHFWFPNINKMAEETVQACKPCQLYTNKTMKEPLMSIPYPEQPWQDVSIDLFGPMPDRKHVIVVQDIKTRFPAAKVVNSTGAKDVIPAIAGIYNSYGNPDNHRTDNGPPFNSKEFTKFSECNNINHRTSFPYHPQANPVETFMKPLGKAMKVASWERQNKQQAVDQLLAAYRSTPHPSTGQAPGNLMFRGGYKKDITRQVLDREEVSAAYKRDREKKEQNVDKCNESNHRKQSQFEPGDLVMFPKFTDIPFPENDDEDDDFVPDFNDLISLDMEESASQSYSEMDLNSSIEGTTDYDGFFKTTTVAQTTTPASKDEVVVTTPSHRNSISLLRELDSEMREIDEKSRMRQTETEEEIIARRTRSKLPLHNVGLEELETAFDPPDAGDDMCIQSSDEDWLKFLAEVFTQDPGEKTTDIDDDVEQDPDYNFMASEAEETHEKDDYRDDQGTRITKKEVEELLELLNVPVVDSHGQPIDVSDLSIMMSPAKKTTTSKKTTENTKSADVTIPLLEQNQVSVKQHLEIRRRQKSRFFNNNDKIINNKNNEKLVSNNNQQSRCLTFTLNQTRTLKLQLKQHVQLLTQINLLSKNKPEFHKITSEALAMLKEIKQLGKHQKAELRIEASCFDVEHLNDALDITQLKLSSSEPVVNLTKFERNRRMFPLSRQIATVMSQSPVFCYTHLLPACGGLKVNPDTVRKTYSFSVDILLCLGLAQMEGHLRPMYELIHQYMLPTMSPDQIKFRVKNAMNCHYGQNNPIYIYHRTKVIPQPPIISDPDVGPSTGIPNHLGLKSAPIPDWLHMLQLEDSNHSTPTLDNSNQEPQDKYAVLINNPGDPSTSKPPTAIILPIIYNNESSGKKKIKRQDWVRNIRTPIANKRKKSQKKEQKVKKLRNDSEIAKKLKSNSSPTQMEVLNTSNTSFETQPENDETVPLNSTNESQDSEPSTNQMAPSDKDKVDQLNENISPENEISENNSSDNINSSLSKVTSEKNFSVPKSVGSKMAEQIETSPAAKKVESVGQKVPQSQTKKVRTENISSKNSTKLSKKSNKNKIDSNKILSPSLKKKNRSSDVGCDDEVGGTEEDEEETDDEQMHVEDAPTEEEEQKEEKSKKRKKAKCRAKVSSTKLGGRLHRTFPCLGSKKNSGKSRNSASDDQFSKNLRKSAEKVKLLEEDTIVQLDPTRVEKEMLFAEGYLKQLQTVLKDKPDVLIQVLEIMSEFALDAGLSPPILFKKISELLSPWPQLIQGFAPFLLPEQAHACGLLPEQQVYARARKFLRQLEIRFQDNPQHLNRIINTFKSVAESAVYKENEMKSNILTMLKSDPYLQEEFLMFFDNERPPESRLNGDWEEIYWTDDLLKESGAPAGFEEIHVPFSGEGNPLSGTEEANISSSTKFPVSNKQKPTVASNNQSIKKPRRVSKSKTKDKNREDWNLHPRLGVEEEEEDGLTQPPNTASTTAIQHTDVGVISEDALSCNSQHNEDGVSISVNKPPTPTGTQASQDSVSLSDYKLAPDLHSSSHGSSLPITPTGSRSPKSEDQLQDQAKDVDTALQWTREDDATLLGHCKLDGATEQTFSKVASVLKRSKEEIENRFQTLINLISGGDVTDTESVYTDDTEAEDLSD